MDFPSTLDQFLQFSDESLGDHLAVVGDRHWLTFSQLGHRVDQLASFLHRSGLEPGQVIGVQIEEVNAALVASLALARLGAAIVAPTSDWLLCEEASLKLDRVIVGDRSTHHDNSLFLALPSDLGEPSRAEPGVLPPQSERPLLTVPSVEEVLDYKPFWLSARTAWERALTVSAGIKTHARVALCGLQEPSKTLMALGILARGASIMFLPRQGLPASLSRFGIEQLCIGADIANWMAVERRVLAVACPELREVRIHGSRPVPGLANRFSDKFNCPVSFALIDSCFGPLTIARESMLENAPLTLDGVFPDIALNAGQSRSGAPKSLLIQHRLGGSVESAFCAVEDPKLGLLFAGRAERAEAIGALALDVRVIEQVLKSHDGVTDAMAFCDADADGQATLTAVVVASHPCAETLLARCKETLGTLAPAKVIQLELAGLDSRRGYLRNLLRTLGKNDSSAKLFGAVVASESDE